MGFSTCRIKQETSVQPLHPNSLTEETKLHLPLQVTYSRPPSPHAASCSDLGLCHSYVRQDKPTVFQLYFECPVCVFTS